MNKKMVDFSKFLSFVLRHGAKEVGIEMDAQGFVIVDDLMKTGRAKHYSLADLQFVVESNSKKRFEIVQFDGPEGTKIWKIRAVQGHTITVE
jgi:RNA:NAD 2'-phosphotransferase (TPT1/KptA family)